MAADRSSMLCVGTRACVLTSREQGYEHQLMIVQPPPSRQSPYISSTMAPEEADNAKVVNITLQYDKQTVLVVRGLRISVTV